jgi:SAM-dependent methyltransferase
MTETVACNLCGDDDVELLYRLRDYRLEVDDVEWNVVRCRRCGLGYLNPRPSPAEIDRYYPERYFAERVAHWPRYRRMARYVEGQPAKLLDIGAGSGGFLAVMHDAGWEVTGIEPAASATIPSALNIRTVRFPEEADLAAESFDVITAWAVFEHLHDPACAFRECARMLSPGGRLVIEVPNLRSIRGRYSRQEDVPRHLYFFEPRTLARYGELAGLELVDVIHTTDLFGGSGRGVLRLALLRALGKNLTEFFEMWKTDKWERFRRWPLIAIAWTALSAVERVLLADVVVRALRISGEIVAIFRRPVAECRQEEPAATASLSAIRRARSSQL